MNLLYISIQLSFIILLFLICIQYFIEIQRSNYISFLKYMNSELIYVWANHSNWSTPNEIALPDSKVKQISIGYKHIIIRTQNKLWGVGDNCKGQLGTDTHEQPHNSAIQIIPRTILNKVIQVSCGWNHSLILQQNGCVYSAGEGRNGALGHGRGADSYCFKQIQSLKNIKYISAGKDHSLALSSVRVYGWGNSIDGQLGMPKQKICFEPEELYVYSSTLCYAGPKYSIFKTEKGIYVTGSNDGGQLGLGNKTKVKMPKKINSIESEIEWIGGSTNYTLFKTFQNQYYIAGTGCFGQYLYPTKVKNFNKCEYLLIGEEFGILKDQKNNLCTWDSESNIPIHNKQLSSINIRQIKVGPQMIVCSVSDVKKNQNASKNRIQRQFQKNQGFMAKSSIQYTKSPNYGGKQIQYTQNEEGYLIPNEKKKSRKQSQAIQGQKYRMYYGDEDGQKQLYGWGEYNQPRMNKNQMEHQINSPHFKKQSPHGPKIKLQNQDNVYSHRFSDLNQEIQLNYSLENQHREEQKNVLPYASIRNKQNIHSVQSSAQMSKKLNNSTGFQYGKPMIIQNERQIENYYKQKVKYLEKENERKDQYISKMRKQMIELIEIVESDACLKNMVIRRDINYFTSKKAQLASQFQEPDVFNRNAQLLREILGKTIDSLTYSK